MHAAGTLLACLLGAGAAPRMRPSLTLSTPLKTHVRVRMSSEDIDESGAQSSSGMPAMLERRVPYEQQAVVQLKELQDGAFYDWATLPVGALIPRFAVVYVLFAGVGGFVATGTYDFPDELLQIALAGNVGGVFMTLLFMLRIYSGWSYVSERLSMPVLDYEESSWADGFEAKKPDEVRARDQYLNEFTVKPVLGKLRPLVGATAGAALLSVVALKVLGGAPEEPYSPEYLSNLSMDDKAAERERARAAKVGKPAYCQDRYYKVVAGGNGCD